MNVASRIAKYVYETRLETIRNTERTFKKLRQLKNASAS